MKQLKNFPIVAPGFYGLNSQEAGSVLSPNFAQRADNAIIDKYGRLGARKGWTMQTTSGDTQLAGNPVRFLLENIDLNNERVVLSGGNNKLFSGGIAATLTDITPSLYTITDNDWSGATLGGVSIMVQNGHEPVIFDNLATPKAQTMTDYTGAVQNYGTDFPHYVISGYGRFWSHDGQYVYWSTDIADANFPCFCGGTSGTLNIASILPNTTDEIVSLAIHNDFLVIYCKHNIILYSGAGNPIGVIFQLYDIIVGVGCAAKNSVQPTGNDLIFLSDTGIRSLGRLLTEKSLPMRDLSKNVRDELLADLENERDAYDGTLDHVVSVYSEVNAFYLLGMPASQKVYVVDMRSPLQDGASRITTWSAFPCYAFFRDRNRNVYIGVNDGIGLYGSYTDNGTTYTMSYLSHYLDFNSPSTTKLLKQLKSAVIGGYGQQYSLQIGFDYSSALDTYQFNLDTGTTPAIFNSSGTLFGEAYFAGSTDLAIIKSSVAGAGEIVQIGFSADINGEALSVQSLDCFLATGRMK